MATLPRVLTPQQRWLGLGFALFLGVILAAGFLSTSVRLLQFGATSLGLFPGPLMAQILGFPLLCLLFLLSLPGQKEELPTIKGNPWTLSVVPLLIAAGYGAVLPGNFTALFHSPESWQGLVWYVLAAPLGEELLFRGWLYRVTARLWPDVSFTLTNPLPAKVWLPAVAFSLWHTQNLALDPAPLVAFQLAYTLFTGLWLGYLRWITGKILIPILAHVGINLAVNLL